MRTPSFWTNLQSTDATIAACTALILAAGPAQAGPCSVQIAALHSQISTLTPRAATGPMTMQSVGAQLHRQPTPSAIQQAQTVANSNADAALARAQKADQEGDASACMEALRQARQLYGVD